MPSLPTAFKGAAVSWAVVREIGRSLWTNGRERLQVNLSDEERREFGGLLKRSRGRRSKLPSPEGERLAFLVRKAATGDGYASWAAVLRSVATMMPPQLLADAWAKLSSRGGGASTPPAGSSR
jgi:hypothetical protein